ncbi:MAG: flagellar basal body P-ring protein FlgI [Deltaproteobacteria bacterium]|nr:flagellar basal body P-ring protein FlgI [Deltaproteobacteria bacterium]
MRLALLLFSLTLFSATARAERIKELVEIDGVRPNSLVGIGLVVGLNGTGDDASSPVTRRALAGLMKRLGMSLDAAQLKQLKAKNVASVMVTATLPPFARAGSSLDVLISSTGTARSLSGGTLLLTPLKGPDMGTYALAQGAISLGGFAVEGKTGSSVVKNHPTVGRIPNGARIEKDAPGALASKGKISLFLRSPDFTTASRIVDAINESLGEEAATVRDPGAVELQVPKEWNGYVVKLLSVIESIDVVPDAVARIVIDERTGTIVVGQKVRLGAATIAHGSITVRVTEEQAPSQPRAFAKGKTIVTQKSDLEVEEQDGRLVFVAGASTAGDVANALNALGVKPRDLVAIFQALSHSGALRAELVLL